MLLGGHYAPITEAIGFLEADFARVVAADGRWRTSLGGYGCRSIHGPLPSMLDTLLPLTGPLLRYVWVEQARGPLTSTTSSWGATRSARCRTSPSNWAAGASPSGAGKAQPSAGRRPASLCTAPSTGRCLPCRTTEGGSGRHRELSSRSRIQRPTNGGGCGIDLPRTCSSRTAARWALDLSTSPSTA